MLYFLVHSCHMLYRYHALRMVSIFIFFHLPHGFLLLLFNENIAFTYNYFPENVNKLTKAKHSLNSSYLHYLLLHLIGQVEFQLLTGHLQELLHDDCKSTSRVTYFGRNLGLLTTLVLHHRSLWRRALQTETGSFCQCHPTNYMFPLIPINQDL